MRVVRWLPMRALQRTVITWQTTGGDHGGGGDRGGAMHIGGVHMASARQRWSRRRRQRRRTSFLARPLAVPLASRSRLIELGKGLTALIGLSALKCPERLLGNKLL